VTEPTTDVPTDIVATLTGVWAELSRLGAPLAESQWKAATRLPGWNVQAIYAHLIGTERMLEGLPGAPARDPSVPTPHVRNPIGEAVENEVAWRARRSGAEVFAEWEELRATREATLRAAGPAYFTQPVVNPTGPGTMTDFLAVRILDCWIHEQDVRWALDLPARLDGPAAEHTVDRLVRTIPLVVGKRAATPEGRAVRVVISGAVARDLLCEVNGGRAAFVERSAQPPLAVVTFTTEAFVELANGRRPADDLTGVTVEGDAELGRKVAGRFNMMI
jgi:uncharacterized protein (TIGR03083 family)